MTDITQILGKILTEKGIQNIAKQINLDEKTTGKIAQTALPIILKQLADNTKDNTQSKKLDKALENKTNTPDNINISEWEKMIKHIFSDTTQVEKRIASKIKVDKNDTVKVLSALAPLIMWALWVWKKQWLDIKNIWSILESASKNKLVISFLDSDKDGDIKDDLLKIGIKFLKKVISWKK